jgi:hypothetical protein
MPNGPSHFRVVASGLCVVGVALAPAACQKPVDLRQAVHIEELTGGWYDAGIVEGSNKLVPSVTFTIRRTPGLDVSPLQLNVVFKRIVDRAEEDWDEFYVQRVDFPNNAENTTLTVRPAAGYKGDSGQSRAEMLKNSQFRDVRAIIFAKHSSANWVELARHDIPRQILTK